jgi:putative tryptophan/tyrosine transport system permease protein
MSGLLFASIELGLLYSLVVLGVFLTFRILNFPDLTVDGSFVTGAAVTALAITSGIPGLLALVFGFVAGLLAGCITAFLHTVFGISKILSSILTLSILYTVNLRLMDGPNLSLLNKDNIIPWFQFPLNHYTLLAFLIICALAAKFLVDWLLSTEIGLFIRATGDNEDTVRSFGTNPTFTKFIGVALSNGLVGLAGGLVSQYQGFVDINMGIGLIILGLAAFMISEALVSKNYKLSYITTAVILGSIIYQLVINISLRLGLAGTDLRLVTALIVVIFLALGSKQNLFYGRTLLSNKKSN